MGPLCLRLSLTLNPWAKRMTWLWAHDLAEHAPAGSGAQHVRRMMEGGFRRWPKELSMQTQGHT